MRTPGRAKLAKAPAEPVVPPLAKRAVATDKPRLSSRPVEPPAARPRESEPSPGLAREADGPGILEWQVRAGSMRLSATSRTLYRLTEFDGRYSSWLAVVSRDDAPRVTATFAKAFAARAGEIMLEFRIVRPGDHQPRWMENRNLIFYDADGSAERVVAVSVDVTERKRAPGEPHTFTDALEQRVGQRPGEPEADNAARVKAEEALREAPKMQAIGELTGGVAHDFNNLLTVIMGGLEMVERQLPELPKSRSKDRIGRAAAMAREGANRAAKLTSRLLAFARRQPLSPRPFNANLLIANIRDPLRRTLGETIALEIVPWDDIWIARADPNQLENALLNLVVNARDAMPDGGRLRIETGNHAFDAAFAAALEEPIGPGDYVRIAVADTGTGMDKSTLARAFEPFFTTKDGGNGTGLGLSQVYGFVRQSSGHIRIDSEPGNGTTISIYLPREPERSVPRSG